MKEVENVIRLICNLCFLVLEPGTVIYMMNEWVSSDSNDLIKSSIKIFSPW